MTIGQMIDKADKVATNAFSRESKLDWLAELDGKIALDVMLMSIGDVRGMRFSEETELLVGFPHENMYILWLSAQIHLMNEDYERYQNVMEAYNASYNNFVNWFLRTYEPAQGCCVCKED